MCRACANRRTVLTLLAGAPLLAACKPQTEGPEDIRWGREVCVLCGMIISDPHFAAELRSGTSRELLKYDDIGDAVLWFLQQPWQDDPATEFWVRDYATGSRWLEARRAFYQDGVVSPMDYGFGAHEAAAPGLVDFQTMAAAVLKKGLASGCHLPEPDKS